MKEINMKKIIIFLMFVTMHLLLNSTQIDSVKVKKVNYTFISMNYHYGDILLSNEFLEGDNLAGKPIDKYQSGTIKFGWQNPGYAEWQKVYKSPYYGVGFYAADFFSEELGHPLAVFGFLGFPIKRFNKLEIYTEFQYGMAWNWTHYDSVSNYKNIAIGAPITVHVDAGICMNYPITNSLDLGAGISFTHFSNGGFERPQRGINIYAPYVELRHNLKGRPDVQATPKIGRIERSNDLIIMFGYGDHQRTEFEFGHEYHAIAGFSMYYLMQHSNTLKSGLGVDTNFMWGLSTLKDGMQGPVGWDNLTAGFFYQPELVIGKMSIVSGLGIYARHAEYGDFKQLYQRLGVKFHITDNIFAGVNIRAIHFIGAEFFEFNFGYRFRWMK